MAGVVSETRTLAGWSVPPLAMVRTTLYDLGRIVAYGRLYRGRNAFLHGNPVSPKTLQPSDLKVSLFWLAPSLYRLALSGGLNLSFRRKLSKGASAEQIGELVDARMNFNDYQMIAERALLRARK